jgi:EAL domain-containing protein (putative c-di-GMP-specific phosphodiesterase class I)
MFPVDTLKIDRSFIKDLPDDGNSAAIVAGIIALGHSLKLKIVAEGVETEAQRAFLQQEGCDVAQGYFISKPLPTDVLEEWILGEQNQGGHLWQRDEGFKGSRQTPPPL